MKIVKILLITLAVTAIFVGCTKKEKVETSELVGSIVEVNDGSIAITTREDGEVDYIVSHNDNTVFQKGVDQEFVVGNEVTLEVSEILESYPMQTHAVSVLYNGEKRD